MVASGYTARDGILDQILGQNDEDVRSSGRGPRFGEDEFSRQWNGCAMLQRLALVSRTLGLQYKLYQNLSKITTEGKNSVNS